MLVPCPRFEELVHHAAMRGVALANGTEPKKKLLITSHPDGSFGETSTLEAKETVFASLRKDGFPPRADAVCFVLIGIETVDGVPQAGVFVLAAERGASQSYLFAKLFRRGFLNRLKWSDLRLLVTKPNRAGAGSRGARRRAV
jgi:hypothetical protein